MLCGLRLRVSVLVLMRLRWFCLGMMEEFLDGVSRFLLFLVRSVHLFLFIYFIYFYFFEIIFALVTCRTWSLIRVCLQFLRELIVYNSSWRKISLFLNFACEQNLQT